MDICLARLQAEWQEHCGSESIILLQLTPLTLHPTCRREAEQEAERQEKLREERERQEARRAEEEERLR